MFEMPTGPAKAGCVRVDDPCKPGNAVRIGSGPATVKGATRTVAIDVHGATGRDPGKADGRAPSQETYPKVPSQSRRLRSCLSELGSVMKEKVAALPAARCISVSISRRRFRVAAMDVHARLFEKDPVPRDRKDMR